jgi:hypothetical protein
MRSPWKARRLAEERYEHAVTEARRLRAERDRLQVAVDLAHAALDSAAYAGGPSMGAAYRTAMRCLGEVRTEHVTAVDPTSRASSGPGGEC